MGSVLGGIKRRAGEVEGFAMKKKASRLAGLKRMLGMGRGKTT